MEDIIIPIDDKIREFRNHIKANPRTFLSSKFGDGKSYFLREFKEKTNDEFVFITLYPVNYQIAENEDIFNLIKRDILFQLMINGIISDGVEINEEVALYFFIQNNFTSFVPDLLKYMSSVALPPDGVSKVLLALKNWKLLNTFGNIANKYQKFKEDMYAKENLIGEFLNKVDENFVYEEDIVTRIIKDSISEYKNDNPSKQIVLVIEDLDRLDPAHLFRILNVFSAHIDYSYKIFQQPKQTDIIGNKFGFDKVVFVADFKNVKRIFQHFYGEQTDFNGYIGKFLTSAPYEYSIRKIRTDYIYTHLEKNLKCLRRLIETLLPEEILDSKTIRECVQSFDIDSQLKAEPMYLFNNTAVRIDTTILRLLSVMRRLKVEDGEIKRLCLPLFHIEKNLFCRFVAPYLLLFKGTNNEMSVKIVIKEDHGSSVNIVVVTVDPETGLGNITDDYSYVTTTPPTDMTALYDMMLGYVVK